MSANDSLSNSSFSGSLVTTHPQVDSEFRLHHLGEDDIPSWLTSNSRELDADAFHGAFHGDSIEPAFTKVEEPYYDLAAQFDIQKGEFNATSVDVKLVPDTSTSHLSQDLMSMVLGEDSSSLGFNIRLDDDVFMMANKESESSIFPVQFLMQIISLI